MAVGLHPLEAEHWQPSLSDDIKQFAQYDKVVAIGETGLDFYKAAAEHTAAQMRAFRAQIALAQALDLPLIIHCRDAAAATRDLLAEAAQQGPIKGVMHCWGGTPTETQWFLDLGFSISFSGIITFKSAQTLRESAAMVPGDRLLVETDCPFLAPIPHRGKRNEPAYVVQVATTLAAVRQVSLAELARQTTTNARQLFRLPSTHSFP